jgi:hypothetical protein
MKKILLLLFIIPLWVSGQYTDRCIPKLLYKVTASSGMKMREGPGQNNKVVFFVPSSEYLLVCEELSSPATFENKPGNWRRVRYKNHYGYMFDGFITKSDGNLILNDSTWTVAELPDVRQIIDTTQNTIDTMALAMVKQDSIEAYNATLITDSVPAIDSVAIEPVSMDTLSVDSAKNAAIADSLLAIHVADSIKMAEAMAPPPEYLFAVETYNYCGEIAHLDPGIRWYGIYYDDEFKVYRNKRIELQIIRSKYALGSGLEFDVKSENGVSPHFMIGTKAKLDTNLEIKFDYNYFDKKPQSLYPGQQVSIYSTQNIHDIYNFNLFATGTVTDVGQCPEMENYRLKLTGEMNDSLSVQDLSEHISYYGECGMPKIYWFGDLNQDLYPDFILASQGKEQTSFTLFVSDTRKNGQLVRKAGEWSYSKCD